MGASAAGSAAGATYITATDGGDATMSGDRYVITTVTVSGTTIVDTITLE